MTHVTAQNVKLGMVLAQDVVDGRGRLLIPSGKALSERHIDALRMWGILYVEIEGDIDEPVRQVDPDTLIMAEAEVDRRFTTAGSPGEFLTTLREQAVLRTARGMVRSARGRSQ